MKKKLTFRCVKNWAHSLCWETGAKERGREGERGRRTSLHSEGKWLCGGLKTSAKSIGNQSLGLLLLCSDDDDDCGGSGMLQAYSASITWISYANSREHHFPPHHHRQYATICYTVALPYANQTQSLWFFLCTFRIKCLLRLMANDETRQDYVIVSIRRLCRCCTHCRRYCPNRETCYPLIWYMVCIFQTYKCRCKLKKNYLKSQAFAVWTIARVCVLVRLDSWKKERKQFVSHRKEQTKKRIAAHIENQWGMIIHHHHHYHSSSFSLVAAYCTILYHLRSLLCPLYRTNACT